MYHVLVRHQMLRRLRQPRPRLFWLAVVLAGALLLYAMAGLVVMALATEVLLYQWRPGVHPLGFVNSHLVEAALALIGLRFLSQKTHEGSLKPYLHLPISRHVLARSFALGNALSLHNALPLFFAVPFALRSVAAEGGLRGALCWLGGILALLAASDLLNTALRAMVGRQSRRSLLLLTATGAVGALVLVFGHSWIRLGGWMLFNALAAGSLGVLLLCWAFVAALFLIVTRSLAHRLHTSAFAPRTSKRAVRFAPSQSHRNLIRLEAALILRNARPRQFVLVSLVASAAYLIVFLSRGGGEAPSPLAGGSALLLGYMTSGMFALNYGPLMFGWESAYFDGLLARPVLLPHLVRSKLMLLQASCLLLGLVALPFFAWLAPAFTLHLAAAALYNAGVAAPVVLWLALGNRTRLDLERSSVFNFQGVSARHMLWTILLAVPPLALLLLWHEAGLAAVAAISLAGALVSLAWPAPFAGRLLRHRYQMAAAFRSSVS